MEALFLRVVWISLTCSAVLVPLLVGKGWLRQHVRARALYVVWLILALRLVIPGTLFTMPVSVAGAAADLRESVSLALQERSSPSSDTQPDTSVSSPLPEKDSHSSALPEESTDSSADSQADGGSSASLQHDTDSSSQETAVSVPSQTESTASSVQRFASLLSPLYNRYTQTAEYPLGTSQEQLNNDILEQGLFINSYLVVLEGGRQFVT